MTSAQAIIEALGLDPTKICRNGITIEITSMHEPAVVTVRYNEGMLTPVDGVIRKYELVPIDDKETE